MPLISELTILVGSGFGIHTPLSPVLSIIKNTVISMDYEVCKKRYREKKLKKSKI